MTKMPGANGEEFSPIPERNFRRQVGMEEQSPLGSFVFYAALTICILISVFLRFLG